ncbi:transglycosylase SLT domain-containing protein [Zoogloea sp.]|uniref:transglycosylase SLT domain-containing protein n=1 Tax=Zoogloea sp. TaxID=49181 RepID=UPI00260E071D|nr:transglycosylase SLT domain-containing protein [Zoogloea sp.]MDD3355012.1 transglycosylase SLT domain-containing protein [Zoogloea sp.]
MFPRVIALFLSLLATGPAFSQFEPEPLRRQDEIMPGAESAGLHSHPIFEIRDHSVRVPTIDLTVAPDDLWERIRRGFSMPDLNTDLVTDRQIYYINRPGSLRQIFARGQRYLHYIVEELERRGMPTELALLPMVESAFNPMALSSAQASGLWQFIPSTGKSYKLEQNWWVDERRDVIASTNAALDYLQTIYEMHGDWHLALASYNWGEGAVGRAVARNRAAGLPTEYQHLNMPGETRYYVPKLQALKNIVAQPELFGLNLPYIPNRPYFTTVESRIALDLATAARLAETPVEEILALNPGYKRPILPVNGSQSLIIPADKVEAFLINLERHDPDSASWKTYELQEGEALEGVADRLGISATRLRQVNGLSPRARIGSGYTLIVPSEQEGDRITLSRLLPTKPQAGAVEPPPMIIQRTVMKGRNGKAVVVERKVAVRNTQAPERSKGRSQADAPSPRNAIKGKTAASPAGKPAADSRKKR